MANDKTYDRHINIWINGKEVKNDLSSMEKELRNMRNEWKRMTVGTQEWIDKGKEIKKFNGIINEHNASLRKTPGLWDKIKGSMGLVMGAIGVAYGAFQSFKAILESTDESSDKLARTMGGIKEAVNAVSQAMASGNFKNFFRNIKDAVEEGKRYADAQDSAGDSARALALAEEEAADKILALKIIQADATKSREEQIKAGEDIEKVQADLAVKRANKAQIDLDNEMENARFRSKLSDETIKAFLRQDGAMQENMKIGKQYYDKVQEFGQLSTAEALIRQNAYEKELEALGADAPKYAAIYAGMSKVTETHRDRIIAAEKEVSSAKRSSTEDILRQIYKLHSAQAAQDEEEEKLGEKAKARADKQKEYNEKYGLEDVIAKAIETTKYDPGEFKELDKALDEFIEKSHKADAERVQSNKEAEDKIVQEYGKSKEEALKLWKERTDAEKAMQEAQINEYMDFGKRIGDALGQAMDDGVLTAKEASKALLNIALEALQKFALVKIAEGAADSIAKYGPLLGALRTIAITALIEGAIEAAKARINNMWTGGYTGPGGKYEPKGIVHGGEWVANADMVASPVTGPVIRALEGVRTGSMPGYANGGYESSGFGAQAARQRDMSLLTSDDQLKQMLKENTMVLKDLKKNGVRTFFTYLDIDKVKRGMDKLDNIKGSVTMRE